jgi:hypothetical protein
MAGVKETWPGARPIPTTRSRPRPDPLYCTTPIHRGERLLLGSIGRSMKLVSSHLTLSRMPRNIAGRYLKLHQEACAQVGRVVLPRAFELNLTPHCQRRGIGDYD